MGEVSKAMPVFISNALGNNRFIPQRSIPVSSQEFNFIPLLCLSLVLPRLVPELLRELIIVTLFVLLASSALEIIVFCAPLVVLELFLVLLSQKRILVHLNKFVSFLDHDEHLLSCFVVGVVVRVVLLG